MKREYYLKHRERILQKMTERYHDDPQLRKRKRAYDRQRELNDPLMGVYKNMLSRCYNPRNKSYFFYGGRGIKVCQEWHKSYAAFKQWALSRGWQKELLIDRQDVDGDYEPVNCRFVSITESNQNRRFIKLTIEKAREIRRLLTEGMTIKQLAEMFQVSRPTIRRIKLGKIWKETA